MATTTSQQAQQARIENPGCVPLVCRDQLGKIHKLCLPRSTLTGKHLRRAVNKHFEVECALMMLTDGTDFAFSFGDEDLVSELEKKHMHPDGCLFMTVHTEQQPQAITVCSVIAEKDAPHKAAASIAVCSSSAEQSRLQQSRLQLVFPTAGQPAAEQAVVEKAVAEKAVAEKAAAEKAAADAAAAEACIAAETQVTELREKNEHLLSQIASFKKLIEGSQGEVANKVAELQKVQYEHQCDKDKLQGEFREVAEKLAAVQAECHEMAAFKPLAAQLEEKLEFEKLASTAQIAALTEQLEYVSNELESLTARSEQQKSDFEQKLVEKDNEGRLLQAQLDDAMGQSQTVQDQKSEVEKEMLAITLRMEAIIVETQKMDAEQESLRSQLQSVEVECDYIKQSAESESKEQSLKHSAEIKSLVARSESARTAFKTQEVEMEDRIAQQDERIREAEAQRAKDLDEIASLKVRIAELDSLQCSWEMTEPWPSREEEQEEEKKAPAAMPASEEQEGRTVAQKTWSVFQSLPGIGRS